MVRTSEVIGAHPVTHRHRLSNFLLAYPCTNYKPPLKKTKCFLIGGLHFSCFPKSNFTLFEIAVLSVVSLYVHTHALYCMCMCKTEGSQHRSVKYTGVGDMVEDHGNMAFNIV